MSRMLFQDEYATRELHALVDQNQRRVTLAWPAPSLAGADAPGAAPATKQRGWMERCVTAVRRGCTDMLQTRASRRPLALLCVLMFLQQFSGSYVTLFYAVTFFQVACPRPLTRSHTHIAGHVAPAGEVMEAC